MKRALFLAVVAIALSVPVLATAVGPFDGAYSVTESSSGGDFLDYVVVLQKGTDVAIAILLPDVESWYYGRGTLNGSTATGTLFVPDGTSFGTFQLTLGADGSLSGTLTTSETANLSGSRIF
jgi:hypothetical protein